jgi:hypothetical protein
LSVENESQHDEATTSSIKGKSLSWIKSTEISEIGVRGVTPKKRNWREYIDASLAKPYYSNKTITTWDKPVDVKISFSPASTPRTPSVSNQRKSASSASIPITSIMSTRRVFTMPASTPPHMRESRRQPKPKQQQFDLIFF